MCVCACVCSWVRGCVWVCVGVCGYVYVLYVCVHVCFSACLCVSLCALSTQAVEVWTSLFTVIHSSTLGIRKKVTKLPCFWYIVFRTQFQHFLGVFWRSFLAVQLAFVSMSTITLISSLSIFPLQTTRLLHSRGEQGRTRGEPRLYFEVLWPLNLWLFSWLSHQSREAQNWACRG